MKFGTETGSVVNHIRSRQTRGAPTPEIGMGATVLLWTDRHAATVIGYDPQKRIVTIQEDHAKRTDQNGFCEMQEYEYTPDPDGLCYHFRWNTKKETWEQVRFNNETGRWNKINGGGCGIFIGSRETYRDFTF